MREILKVALIGGVGALVALPFWLSMPLLGMFIVVGVLLIWLRLTRPRRH